MADKNTVRGTSRRIFNKLGARNATTEPVALRHAYLVPQGRVLIS